MTPEQAKLRLRELQRANEYYKAIVSSCRVAIERGDNEALYLPLVEVCNDLLAAMAPAIDNMTAQLKNHSQKP